MLCFRVFLSWEEYMKSNLIVGIISVVIGSFITIFGQPYVNDYFESSKTPILLKELHQTNIDNLPNDVKKQITLVTTRYNLRQIQGGTAEHLTIKVTSSDTLLVSNLIVDKKSEANKLLDISETFKKIEVDSIRPNGSLSFEVTHSPSNLITIEEIAKLGMIIESEIEQIDDSFRWWEYLLIIMISVIFPACIVLGLFFFLNKVVNYFYLLESGQSKADYSSLAWIIAIITIFCILSKIKGFPLPEIHVSELFYAVMLFIVISNYKKIKNIIDNQLK